MDVALLASGRLFGPLGERFTVPMQVDRPPRLLISPARHAQALRDVGFTALQLLPISKAMTGADRGCDGDCVFGPRSAASSIDLTYLALQTSWRFPCHCICCGRPPTASSWPSRSHSSF